MKLEIGVFLFSAALCLAGPAEAQERQDPATVSEASAIDWREAAQTDVLAAYATYIDNHPGVYDLKNQGFPAQLSAARKAGLEEAAKTENESGYRRALAAFSAALSDGHALAFVPRAQMAGRDGPLWPGFVAVWRGDSLLVRMQNTSDPLHEAEIIACEGEPIVEFLSSALLTRYFRPREAGQWWRRPSQLFFADDGNIAEAPSECRFVMRDGAVEVRRLDWRKASRPEQTFYDLALGGDRVPTALTEPRNGIFLIGLQDFQPDAEEVQAYRRMYEAVAERRPELLAARALVLDLRHNNGGSSSWSEDLAHLLWGKAAVESRQPEGAQVWWRASLDNTDHVRKTADLIRAQGHADTAEAWEHYAAEMDSARARGEMLWRQDDVAISAGAPVPSEAVTTDFSTPVYVITHCGCASACLDALDTFTLFENTRLIGAPTSADSVYMEVRVEALPAGPGQLVVPVKFYAGRQRAGGEIYQPDILMTEIDWSTERFLDRIEADLAGR